MSGWFIFGGVVLLLVLLFTRSVVVTAEYDEEKLDVKVKYLFFTLYPQKPKQEKSPKKKRRKSAEAKPTDGSGGEENGEPPEESAEQEPVGGEIKSAHKGKVPKKKKRKKFAFDLEQIMDYVRSASPPIKRLFKKIRVSDLYIDYVVATDDAAKTAIKYGSVCAALYPAIEWLTTYFAVRARRVHVEADFSEETDDIFAYCKIKLRVSTALGCILWLGARVIKTYFKYQKKQEVQA